MKKFFLLCLALTLLASGCATTVEPTAIPVNPTAAPVAPQSQQATSTAPLPPTGQCQSKLLGRVVDANGQPAKGAIIDIKSGNFTGKTLSDDNGLYGFAGLCAGNYSFTVTLSGQPAKPVAGTAALDGANSNRMDLTVK
jgi:protocatechuate 3,4-dioxygenase beta subunit